MVFEVSVAPFVSIVPDFRAIPRRKIVVLIRTGQKKALDFLGENEGLSLMENNRAASTGDFGHPAQHVVAAKPL